MLRPSKRIEYALMSLKYMVQRPGGALTSAREICDQFKTPFDTTAKVMQILNNAKILKSVKGVKGGYMLVRDLKTLSYFELTTLIEGPVFENHCTREQERCDRLGVCIISKSMNLLDQEIGNFLKNISVQDIINEQIIHKYGNAGEITCTSGGHRPACGEEETHIPPSETVVSLSL